jgi:hypothetical protein
MMFARTSLSQSEFVHLIGLQREDASKLGAGSASQPNIPEHFDRNSAQPETITSRT